MTFTEWPQHVHKMFDVVIQDVAATRIQASYRGYKTRSNAKKGEKQKRREEDAGDEDDAKKQVRLQGAYFSSKPRGEEKGRISTPVHPTHPPLLFTF